MLGVPSYGYTIPRYAVPNQRIPGTTPSNTIDNRPVYTEAIFNRIKDALSSGYLVVVLSGKADTHDGISPCQSYSVL